MRVKCLNCGMFFNGIVYPNPIILHACKDDCLYNLLSKNKTNLEQNYKKILRPYRSKLEAIFAAFCKKYNIDFVYEPEQIDKYIPDFYLIPFGIYIEIKDLSCKERITKTLRLANKLPIYIVPAHTLNTFKGGHYVLHYL